MAKKNSMQWFIDRFNKDQSNDKYGHYKLIKERVNAFSHGKKADKKVKYCDKCGCCWEMSRLYKQVLYYEDFPKRGKKQERCPKHKGK